jgi:hypothetical protein
MLVPNYSFATPRQSCTKRDAEHTPIYSSPRRVECTQQRAAVVGHCMGQLSHGHAMTRQIGAWVGHWPSPGLSSAFTTSTGPPDPAEGGAADTANLALSRSALLEIAATSALALLGGSRAERLTLPLRTGTDLICAATSALASRSGPMQRPAISRTGRGKVRAGFPTIF